LGQLRELADPSLVGTLLLSSWCSRFAVADLADTGWGDYGGLAKLVGLVPVGAALADGGNTGDGGGSGDGGGGGDEGGGGSLLLDLAAKLESAGLHEGAVEAASSTYRSHAVHCTTPAGEHQNKEGL